MRRIVVAVTLALAVTSSWSNVISTFDTDLEGWTQTGGSIAHVGTGGNPGGYLAQQDVINTLMGVFAPSRFLGDLSQYLGGTLSFDAKNVNSVAADLTATPGFGSIFIVGGGTTAARLVDGGGVGAPPPDGAWHSYSTSFDPLLWTGDLQAVLADVQSIYIRLEFNNVIGRDIAGFDNFAIRTIPAPSTALLALLGCVFLARRRNREA